jgi:molybdenum cofactor cytidylyltransferase
MNTQPAIGGLVLAAGASRRMGCDKALIPYRGRTFLETIIAMLREAGILQVAVVLGHHAEEIQRAADLSGVEVVINSDYRLGQTSSLKAGLRAFAGRDLDAIVLCLVDHPAVSSATIRRLIGAYLESQAPVVVPVFDGRRGHPVLLSRELFGSIHALSADQGANQAIRQYREQTRLVPVHDAGVVLDIDDPAALASLR